MLRDVRDVSISACAFLLLIFLMDLIWILEAVLQGGTMPIKVNGIISIDF